MRGIRTWIGRLRTAEDRATSLRVQLGGHIARCHLLMSAVNQAREDESSLGAVQAEIDAWVEEVLSLIEKERPGWSAMFVSNPVAVQSGDGGTASRASNYLRQREAALRHLLALLG